jgi:phenylalanyl-tRNA synthetase beta chain
VRLSLEWLSDFVDLPQAPELLHALSCAGVEVDAIEDPSQKVVGVVVAEVTEVAPHPQAERLQVCQVSDGTQQFTVVCGAPNVRPGLRVAFAPLGASLPGMRIGKRTLRGIASQGMLCGRSELGLGSAADAGSSSEQSPGKAAGGADSRPADPGLWELPSAWTLGQDLLEAAQLLPVLELGITPNRPDLLSHLGVGRELAAFCGKRHKPAKSRATEKGPDVGSLARVVVEDTVACRRYVARVVRNVRVGPSPQWLVDRLERIGQRSINNVVDATNYVMHEVGHPLHAFDLTRLSGEAGVPTVRVRRAAAGETLLTLDGATRKLHPEDLVIADVNRAVALAGVLGGADSEVTATTSTVLIESAYFEPKGVRATALRHGLRTEASLRFGRGADPSILAKAVDRCAQMLADIAEGEIAKGLLESSQKPEVGREIPLRLGQLPRLLGITLPAETVVQLLEPLEIRCTNRTEGALVFMAPGFRPDITQEVDLVEEVARRYGYERLEARLPNTAGPYTPRPIHRRDSDIARQALLGAGLNEIVTYGFGSPVRFAAAAPQVPVVRIINPLGEEYSCMRSSLLPGVLTTLQRNLSHGGKHIRLFEVGTVFSARGSAAEAVPGSARDTGSADAHANPSDAASDRASGTLPATLISSAPSSTAIGVSASLTAAAPLAVPGGRAAPVTAAPKDLAQLDAHLPHESSRVLLALCGGRDLGRWYETQEVDFGDLRGAIEALVEAFDLAGDLQFLPPDSPLVNPLCGAQLQMQGRTIGWAGQLRPQVAQAYGISPSVFAAELDLNGLRSAPERKGRYRPLPKFPSTRRDVALVAPRSLPYATLQSFIAEKAGGDMGASVVEKVALFDVYHGKPLASDAVSLAFAIDYRSATRTLTDAEVATAFAHLCKILPEKFPVQLR